MFFPHSQTLSREHYSDEGLLSETLVIKEVSLYVFNDVYV